MLKKILFKYIFYILDLCLPKHNHYYAFTVGCVDKQSLFDNSRAVFEYIKQDPSKKKIIFIYKPNTQLNLDNYVNTEIIYLYTLQGLYLLAQCKNIFVMHSFLYDYAEKLPKNYLKINFKSHNIINLWHGIPLKAIQRISHGGCQKSISQEFDKYKALIASSQIDSYIMSTCFSPIEYKNIWITGLPKYDFLLMPEESLPEQYSVELDKLNSIINNKKLIIYSPTFRESNANIGYYKFTTNEISNLKAILQENNAILGIRLHPCSNHGTESNILDLIDDQLIIDLGQDIILESAIINRVADIIITDYSSLFLDAVYMNKPLIGFVYDLDDYISKQRGLLYDYNLTFPGYITQDYQSFSSVLQLVLKSPQDINTDKYILCKNMFFANIDDKNAHRVIEQIQTLTLEHK